MITRNVVIKTIGALLAILSVVTVVTFPGWALLIGFGLAEDYRTRAGDIPMAIAAPFLVLGVLWALFLSMTWATKPVEKAELPASPSER